MTLVVNLYGGPGAGKSTIAAQLFAKLKWDGCICELVTEYAKRLTWQKSGEVLKDQIHVFGEQQHMLKILNDQVNVIITDSPILLSMIYGDAFLTPSQRQALDALVIRTWNTYDNLDIFLVRTEDYIEFGRSHGRAEAEHIDIMIKDVLKEHEIEHVTLLASDQAYLTIRDLIYEAIA